MTNSLGVSKFIGDNNTNTNHNTTENNESMSGLQIAAGLVGGAIGFAAGGVFGLIGMIPAAFFPPIALLCIAAPFAGAIIGGGALSDLVAPANNTPKPRDRADQGIEASRFHDATPRHERGRAPSVPAYQSDYTISGLTADKSAFLSTTLSTAEVAPKASVTIHTPKPKYKAFGI